MITRSRYLIDTTSGQTYDLSDTALRRSTCADRIASQPVADEVQITARLAATKRQS